MVYCHGSGCPSKAECYRHTQPSPGRDALASLPYDFATASCDLCISNRPTEDWIRGAAYYIWLHAGRPEHRAEEHWNAAYRRACASTGRTLAPPDAETTERR